jgi:hypothetical protein
MAQAGAMAEAGNIQARRDLMNQANSQFDQMNMMNAAQGARMGDAAIGQAGQFANAQAAIGNSGISGSKNMERNLQYGKDRADAEAQLQFDIMGNNAQQVENSMAQSFDQLTQNKAGAMIDAYTGTQGGLIGQHNANKTAMGEMDRRLRPTLGDAQQVAAEAGRLMTDEERGAAAGNAQRALADRESAFDESLEGMDDDHRIRAKKRWNKQQGELTMGWTR